MEVQGEAHQQSVSACNMSSQFSANQRSSGGEPEHVSQARTMEKEAERTLNRSSYEPASQLDAEEENQI